MAMDKKAQRDDDRWTEVMEHLDLLFARVGDIDRNQQKIESHMNMSNKVVEQMLQDQQMMVKQIEATGKAVAQLTLNQKPPRQDRPSSPTSSETSKDLAFTQSYHGPQTSRVPARDVRGPNHFA